MKEFTHEQWSLHEAVDALMAYDVGATDSGVSDPELKQAVKEYLLNLDTADFNAVVSKFARKYLTDQMITAGYGLESVKEFIEWLDDMGIVV
jgi:hypothetical protein